MRRLDSCDAGFQNAFDQLRSSVAENDPRVEAKAREIIAAVRRDGDGALIALTRSLDRYEVAAASALEVPISRRAQALASIDASARAALQAAAARIRHYHEQQQQASWRFDDEHGVTLGQQVTPMERVGLYVPGGKAAYPSSVLMNAIPAKVAGVAQLIMVVPAPRGVLNDMVLAAAQIAEVDRVFSIGGAQAVAALAYGTDTVPRVDKIVGPGNAYVAAAKKLVFGVVGIDMIAGPSEVVVLSDATSSPTWVAMDLFAQAEHDEDARAVLLCPQAEFLDRVEAEVKRLLPTMERRDIIAHALERRGALVKTKDLSQAVELVNRLAPEHLELSVADPHALLPQIKHAGAIFLGHHAAEALGDYCAGPNHVLPTGCTARFSSPLGVYDFQKRSSVIGCSADGARHLAVIASVLARSEGLTAHARSAELRMQEEAN